MTTTQEIFYNADDVDGEPGNPVNITKTIAGTPTTIIGYFDNGAMEQRFEGVIVQNNMPNIKTLTTNLPAIGTAATYTIGGVVYREAGREQLDPEVTQVNLTEVTTL